MNTMDHMTTKIMILISVCVFGSPSCKGLKICAVDTDHSCPKPGHGPCYLCDDKN